MDKVLWFIVIFIAVLVVLTVVTVRDEHAQRAEMVEDQLACYEIGGKWVIESEFKGHCWHEGVE